MSEQLPSEPNQTRGGGGQFAPSWRGRQRRASVTLRRDGEGGEEAGSMMDPATQSLSDALRVTYRFVQLAVLALVVVYIFSGFRRVEEGERGIRLVFGRVVANDLQPGFQFSLPEPIGELVKVRTGAQTLTMEDDFFPQLTPEEKKAAKDIGMQTLANGGYAKLNPETDGSLIMGDGNIAHTRWNVTYHREDPARVEASIHPDYERAIVLAACKQAVVRAVASVSIDELLKNTADPGRQGAFRPVESRAKDIAQELLAESGISIDIMSMTAKIPPRRVMAAFNLVQSSQSEAQKMKEDAGTERDRILTNAAGDAAKPILAQIDAYERALELKKEDEASSAMNRINALLDGQPVTVDGKEVRTPVYGTAATLLSQASTDKSTYINALIGETARFTAKLETYRKNGKVLLNTEWADAFSTLMARQSVQSIFLPSLNEHGRFVLQISKDPQIEREQLRRYNEDKAKKAADQRARDAANLRFTTPTDPNVKAAQD